LISTPRSVAVSRRRRHLHFSLRRRALVLWSLLAIIVALAFAYGFNRYWQHRFDPLIARHANFYNLDPDLVWSVIYEETYFRPWMHGDAEEVGLMQVTPTVAREWAGQTGLPELARRTERDPASALSDPERNIQIGCWYLEQTAKPYRDEPAAHAKMLAAYNAGPSRVVEWSRPREGEDGKVPLSEAAFIERIRIPSTRAYVTSILARYRRVKTARAAKLAASANSQLESKIPRGAVR
jgi:soluble lytic murein transglycosylase